MIQWENNFVFRISTYFLWFTLVHMVRISNCPLVLHYVQLLTRPLHSRTTPNASYISFKTYAFCFLKLFLSMSKVFTAARSNIIYLHWQREQLPTVLVCTRPCILEYFITGSECGKVNEKPIPFHNVVCSIDRSVTSRFSWP